MRPAIRHIIAVTGCALKAGEPLARHTSFRIGGPADLMAFPRDERELAAVLQAAAAARTAVMPIGNGTNLLAGDRGIRGVVVKMTRGFRAIERSGLALRVGAGCSLPRLVDYCLAHGLSGLEWAVGIPGSVGGALVMNAGAYGGQMSDVVTAVRGLLPTGRARTLRASALRFSYRHAEYPAGLVITGCTLRMKPGRPPLMRRAMDEWMAKRRFNQPLSLPSAGCIFKNPAGDSARRLIGLAGLRGSRVGGAQVSAKHANFIVNRGHASAKDVLALIRKVRALVARKTGVKLELELKLVGRA